MRTFNRLIAGVAGAAVLAGGSLLATPTAATAAPKENHGHWITPGPVVGGEQWSHSWLGSFEVNGRQVWCVQFGLESPEADEQYEPGGELTNKWGEPLAEGTASKVSYMLLRHGRTTSPDEAAAVAHLLHSWTSAPRYPGDLDPNEPVLEIPYDIEHHAKHMPENVAKLVKKFSADAEANHGPWKASLTAPEGQTVGQSGEWTLKVTRPDGKGVSGVPVKLKAKDAKIEGLSQDGTVTTPEDGDPLQLKVTPTGPNPKVTGELTAPTAQPNVQQAVHEPDTTQRVVSTGGEKKLAVQAATTATFPSGSLKVTKLDTGSQAGIAGVALRVTAPDGSPALREDNTPLVGKDGQPVVVKTAADGTVSVPALKAPQELRVTEVAPAAGYEEAFDAQNPPSATGSVTLGETVELTLTNKANTPTVPVKIPAGDPTGGTGPDTGLLGLGGLVLAGGIGVGGFALRRRVIVRAGRE